jgi:hypothetical protein
MGSPGDTNELRQALLGTVAGDKERSREPTAGEEAGEGSVMVVTRDEERGAWRKYHMETRFQWKHGNQRWIENVRSRWTILDPPECYVMFCKNNPDLSFLSATAPSFLSRPNRTTQAAAPTP